MIGAFGLLRSLSAPAELPQRTRALETLRRFIDERGGTIRKSDLDQLDDDLARHLALSAIRHRIMVDAIENGPPVPFEGWRGIIDFIHENLSAVTDLARNGDPPVQFHQIDDAWFATYFTRICLVEAWNNQPFTPGKGLGPTTTHVIVSSYRELVKVQGIERALARNPSPAQRRELLDLRDRATKKILLAAFSGSADAKSLARGAEVLPPELREIYQWANAHVPADGVGGPPEVAHSILERLGLEGVYALKVAAAREQQQELGPLPVLRATARHLEDQGLLDSKTFDGLVVRLRSHALPSFGQLIDQMEHYGMRNFAVDASKGTSTSPLTIAGIERSALWVDPAYGDSWRSPQAQARHLRRNAEASLEQARQSKQPLLMLGEGYASARSLHDAAAKYPDVRIGYVAFTQSGLNFLRGLPKLRFFVESLADALLKKLVESRPLGGWVVDRELELQKEEGAKAPEEQTAVVIGYGDSVGPGIASALKERGFGRVVIVDRDPSRLAQAIRDGVPKADVRLAAEDGSFPPGDLYFTAAGQPNIVNETALRSVPDGAVVVIHGSSVESDKHFIHRARTNKIPKVRARALEKEKMRDHRTLEIAFKDRDHKKVRLRKMGQPFFDGRVDKDKLLVDVYMSGLLAALAVAAKRLKGEPEPNAIHTLDRDLQLAIAEQIEVHYGVRIVDETRASLGG